MSRLVSQKGPLNATTGSSDKRQFTNLLGKRALDDADGSQIKSAPAAARQLSPPGFKRILSSSEPLHLYSRRDPIIGALPKRTKLTDTLKASASLLKGLAAEPGDKHLPFFCQCLLAGCLHCYPGEYHAIHCGSSSCEDCAYRPPGYDIWRVCHTASDEDMFTEGDAVMSRTYDSEKNVLSLVLARRLFKAMHNSVLEGRLYRKTRRRIDAELDVIY